MANVNNSASVNTNTQEIKTMNNPVVKYEIIVGLSTSAPSGKYAKSTIAARTWNGFIFDASQKRKGAFLSVNVLQSKPTRQDKHTPIYAVYANGLKAEVDARSFWQAGGLDSPSLELKADLDFSEVEKIREDYRDIAEAETAEERADLVEDQIKRLVLEIPADDMDSVFQVLDPAKVVSSSGRQVDVLKFTGKVSYETKRWLHSSQSTNFDKSKIRLKSEVEAIKASVEPVAPKEVAASVVATAAEVVEELNEVVSEVTPEVKATSIEEAVPASVEESKDKVEAPASSESLNLEVEEIELSPEQLKAAIEASKKPSLDCDESSNKPSQDWGESSNNLWI